MDTSNPVPLCKLLLWFLNKFCLSPHFALTETYPTVILSNINYAEPMKPTQPFPASPPSCNCAFLSVVHNLTWRCTAALCQRSCKTLNVNEHLNQRAWVYMCRLKVGCMVMWCKTCFWCCCSTTVLSVHHPEEWNVTYISWLYVMLQSSYTVEHKVGMKYFFIPLLVKWFWQCDLFYLFKTCNWGSVCK